MSLIYGSKILGNKIVSLGKRDAGSFKDSDGNTVSYGSAVYIAAVPLTGGKASKITFANNDEIKQFLEFALDLINKQ